MRKALQTTKLWTTTGSSSWRRAGPQCCRLQPQQWVLPCSAPGHSQLDESSPKKPRSRCQVGPPRFRRPRCVTPREGAPITHDPSHHRPQQWPTERPPSKREGSHASKEWGLESLQEGFTSASRGRAFFPPPPAASNSLAPPQDWGEPPAGSSPLVQSCAVQRSSHQPHVAI